MEEIFVNLLKEYGYVILYFWSILEGESGIIITSIISTNTDELNIFLIVFVAALGGFTGDQIYFLITRYNRKIVHKKLYRQRRKFALAHILLRKYGWLIIFCQRFLYGLRIVMPMAIGLTSYKYKTYVIINFISSLVWATIIATLASIFKDHIMNIFNVLKSNWPITLIVVLVIIYAVLYYFRHKTKRKPRFEDLINKLHLEGKK